MRLRTGCCPDAGDVRCRRRDPGAYPGTSQTGCCRDGDRPDEGLNHPGGREPPALPELQPWEPDAHRAWRPWKARLVQPELQRLLEPPELTTPEPEQQARLQQERVLLPWRPVPEQQVPEPWRQQDQAQAQAPGVQVPGWQQAWMGRQLRLRKRQRRGKRCGVSSQRVPQWWKRRSERIRPVPAVWLLHLWK